MAYRKASPRPLRPAFLDRAKRALRPADRTTHTSPYGFAWWAVFLVSVLGALAGAAAAPTHRRLVCESEPADARCNLIDYHLWLFARSRPITSVSAHEPTDDRGRSLLVQADDGPVWIRTDDAEAIASNLRRVGVTPLPGLLAVTLLCLGLAAFFAVLLARLARRSRLRAYFAEDVLRIEIASPVRLPAVDHVLSSVEVSDVESVDDSDAHEVVVSSERDKSSLKGSHAECSRLREWVLTAVADAKAAEHARKSEAAPPEP